jgi:hypothetical protein
MKALCYEGPRKILYEDFAEPKLLDDRDVIVKMDRLRHLRQRLAHLSRPGLQPGPGFLCRP